MVAIVVAYARNGVIGRDGGLPWHLPADLRHFRELTTGHAVLMGRRTFQSLPDAFRPLPGRRNLVLSGDPAYAPAGAEVFASLEAALAACDGDCFVIGGGLTYRAALPRADRVFATRVLADVEGDTTFPALAEDDWHCVRRSQALTENDHAFEFLLYERRPA